MFENEGESSFSEVLSSASKGAEWAFERLYRAFCPGVYAYLRAQAPVEAEDLTADVFVAIVEQLSGFSGGEAEFRSWIFTIAHHRLADHRRRLWRRPSEAVPTESLADHAGPGDAESEAIRGLLTDTALERIAALPPDQAEVILLRIIAGMSAGEVGRLLGKSEGAVRSLQHRGLRRLARELARDPAARAV